MLSTIKRIVFSCREYAPASPISADVNAVLSIAIDGELLGQPKRLMTLLFHSGCGNKTYRSPYHPKAVLGCLKHRVR